MSALRKSQKLFVRALRCVGQILYRKKKKDQISMPQEDITQHKDEINKLEQWQRALLAAIPPKENAWSVALDFHVFRYGLRPSAKSSQCALEPTIEFCAQLDFVCASMAPDVVINRQQGADGVIRSWGCLSLWFKDVSVVLQRLEKKPAGSVITATCTSVTITEKTLRKVFLHLWLQHSKRGCLVTILANKLLGQRIVMRGSIHFEWDGGYGRVSCVRAQSDMLTPSLELLGNLQDVARVFEQGLITPDSDMDV